MPDLRFLAQSAWKAIRGPLDAARAARDPTGNGGRQKLRAVAATAANHGDWRGIVVVFLGLLALLWAQFAWVRISNFGGYDEWLLLSLTSKGIINSPYSNRPFNFLWTLPGVWFTPYSFTGYYLLHATYLWLWGVCVFWICYRLLPSATLLGFLAGVFSVVWMPLDLLRLSALQGTFYSGFTLSMLLAVLLYTESWLRQSVVGLAVASAAAYLTVRGYEATAPLLLVAPLLVLWREVAFPRRRWPWLAVWVGTMAAALVQVLWPMLFPTGEPTYQNTVWGGLDPHPGHVFTRLVRQYGFHLIPLVRSRWTDLGVAAVPVSLAAFAGTFLLAVPRFASGMQVPERRALLLGLMALGLGLAGLGYGPFVLSGAQVWATRMQFCSTPGIALFLAGGIGLTATGLPKRWQRPAVALLAAWVVAVGSGQTVVMQRAWDTFNYHPRQRHMLSQLVAVAPDLQAGTLILLIDDAKAWPATFGFRHAVEYLYPERATGCVWKAYDLLYPTTLDPSGIRTVPWPSIQKAWDARPTTHRYSDVVVFRYDVSGTLTLLDRWPTDLPALPKDAPYLPRSRLATLATDLPERAVLR